MPGSRPEASVTLPLITDEEFLVWVKRHEPYPTGVRGILPEEDEQNRKANEEIVRRAFQREVTRLRRYLDLRYSKNHAPDEDYPFMPYYWNQVHTKGAGIGTEGER